MPVARARRRRREARRPQPGLAMHMAGIQDRTEQRHRAAGHHGYLRAADEIADAERIRRSCRQVDVPADGGQAQQFQPGMTTREGDGQGIVNPRVTVEKYLPRGGPVRGGCDHAARPDSSISARTRAYRALT